MKLEIRNVSKNFAVHTVLDQISCILDAKAIAILGPSGSGKSSLLRILSGLDIPNEGDIYLDGSPIPFNEPVKLLTHRKNIGVVFQSWNLFPHLTALENIILPLQHVHKVPYKEALQEAYCLLSRFSLSQHADKKPIQLSGGQNQRVALLRAIAAKPKLLILDEPTSALDPLATIDVLDVISDLKEQGTSLILASHHLPFIERISEYVLFLSDGKLIESASTDLFFSKPKHPLVQEYLQKIYKYGKN